MYDDDPVDEETNWLRMAGARKFIEEYTADGTGFEVAFEHVRFHYFLTDEQVRELRREYRKELPEDLPDERQLELPFYEEIDNQYLF